MEKIKDAIKILQAFNEGKTIEYLFEGGNFNSLDWKVYQGSAKFLLEQIGDDRYQFRIHQEPTYRPYANAEEFLKASKEHGPYLSNRIPIQYANDGVFLYSDIDDDSFDLFKWETLFNTGCRWQDGTPCGILEE